jgi:hypothetical protein
MLRAVALEYAEDGPMRQVQDARALLTLLPGLDEEGARVYLDRFMTKWTAPEPPTPEEVAASGFSRRRPMTEFERRVHARLLARESPREVVIEFDAEPAPSRAKKPRRKVTLPSEPRFLGIAITHIDG